jgi:adenylate cyclase
MIGHLDSSSIRAAVTSSVIALLAFGIVSFLWLTGRLQQSELWFYDGIMVRAAKPFATDDRISLVLLSEKDIESFDYPLRDDKLSALLEKIESGHPAAIGIDLYRDLPEPRDGSQIATLNKTLAKYPNIVGIFGFGTKEKPFRILPAPGLGQDLNRCGFNDFPIDYKTVRRGFLYIPDSCDYASFGLLLAQDYLATKNIGPTAGADGVSLCLGKTTFRRFRATDGGYVDAADGGYQFLLDYRSPQHFTTRSVDEALKLTSTDVFKDQIVLIGVGAATTTDLFVTPLSGTGQVEGTVIHAQLINQLLRAALDGDQPRGTFTMTSKWLWVFGWCVIGGLGGFWIRSYVVYALALVLGAGLLYESAWLLFNAGWWVPVAAPGLAFLLTTVAVKSYIAYFGEMQRARLMNLFSQHVAPDVAEMLWRERDKFAEGGRPAAQRVTATVLFTDLRGYSTLSETMTPQQLMNWVDQCLGALGGHVGKNGGFINKFIGDAIMALFGVPVAHHKPEEIAQDAINAVTCAVEMGEELSGLNKNWQAEGKPAVQMRIGIHTGELMAGVLGSKDRMEYTVIGDSVNIAARLESVDKENELSGGVSGECRIIISESTYKLVEDHFEFQRLGEVVLKGREEKTGIYKVLARKRN